MPKGVVNIGNTCSINALIQCIAHCKSLQLFLTQYGGSLGENGITEALSQTISELYSASSGCPVVPNKFIQELYGKACWLRHGDQHDICEIWMIVCDEIAKECSCKTYLNKYHISRQEALIWKEREGEAYAKALVDYSKVMSKFNKDNACFWLDMIQGVLITQITCGSCGELYHNFEPFTTLSLDIPRDGATLYECMDAFFTTEQICDWKCDNCKKNGSAIKIVRLWKVPILLCISLKRFVHHDRGLSKNNSKITIPTSINIAKENVMGPQRFNTSLKPVFSYNLKSIGLHSGGLEGGHYTAVCRQRNDFVLYDDTQVHMAGSASADSIDSQEAYLIMYEV